ncbi:MAG: hypothetical protein K8T90_12335 [Planctomycetes bacterium]|nr:hypothetical protein [Planctomycetota bacterium]
MRSPALVRSFVVFALSCAAFSGCAAPAPGAQRSVAETSCRVGVYDSRAVAIAWVRSTEFGESMRELREAHARARAAGDTALATELEARGAACQALVHRQGFGTEPVDDILEHVAADVPAVRSRAGIDVLMSKWAPDAPVVGATDVTDELVRLFRPDAETLRMTRDIRSKAPIQFHDKREGE